MSDDRPPLTDAESATYLETLDHLYGRLRPIESRAETVLAAARSVGDAGAVTRVEAILDRLGEGPGTVFDPVRAAGPAGQRNLDL